jgi:phosphoribosyl 1,2-cyclic phosphodiesterase
MKTALLILEHPAEWEALREGLAQQGWPVLEARTAEAAVELLSQRQPQVIFCEVFPGGADGLAELRTLHATFPGARCVALFRRGCECDRVKAAIAGAEASLTASLTPSELTTLLAALPDGAATVGEPVTRLRFWGVRGSVPTPGPTTVQYGGNTSCVEVRVAGEIILLDAGTGLRPLGRSLEAEFKDRPLSLTLLLTHTHWDHIQGLPYFVPIYKPTTRVRILGYEGARQGLAGVLSAQMESPYFPIALGKLPSTVVIEELRDLEFHVGSVRVQARCASHPGLCMGYRLFTPGGSVAFFPDNETGFAHWTSPPLCVCATVGGDQHSYEEKLIEFLRDVDVLIMDAQYTVEEYQGHIGWGHGCVDDVVALALKARVKKLFLFHHDPDHDDCQVGQLVAHARRIVAAQGGALIVEAAREGLTVEMKPA